MNLVPLTRWWQVMPSPDQTNQIGVGLPSQTNPSGDHDSTLSQSIVPDMLVSQNTGICDKRRANTSGQTCGPRSDHADTPNVMLLSEDKQQIDKLVIELQQLGCCVFQAYGPQCVLNPNHQSEFDLLIIQQSAITDHYISFLSQIRQIPSLKSTYLIFQLAEPDSHTQLQALDAGVDVCVTETESLDLLLAYVRVGLGRRKQHREIREVVGTQTLNMLAVTLAHEINNPLTGILGYLGFLTEALRELEERDLEEMLGIVRTQALRIQALVQKLNQLEDPHCTTYVDGVQMFELTKPDASSGQNQ